MSAFGYPAVSYVETRPPASLASVVDCIWHLSVNPKCGQDAEHWVLPDGCVHLSLRFWGRTVELRLRRPNALPLRGPATAGERFVGVRLRPGAQRLVDLERASAILRECRSPDLFAAGETLVLEAVEASLIKQADERLETLVELVRTSGGSLPVEGLAGRLKMTPRHLERMSWAGLGFAPKMLARVTRLQAAVRTIATDTRCRLADVAAQSGYADQSHMGREFLALGQLTPAEYQRRTGLMEFRLETECRIRSIQTEHEAGRLGGV